MEVCIRKATIDDVDAIYSIEQICFTSPWTHEAYVNELTNNQFATYFVAEFDGEIIGYCGVWVIIDEAHITNIAVLPNYRGYKIGETLLRQAMSFAKMNHAKQMSLEVRVSNEIAQNLYRKLGFQNGGIRKGYYMDNYEDALVMWVKL